MQEGNYQLKMIIQGEMTQLYLQREKLEWAQEELKEIRQAQQTIVMEDEVGLEVKIRWKTMYQEMNHLIKRR